MKYAVMLAVVLYLLFIWMRNKHRPVTFDARRINDGFGAKRNIYDEWGKPR